ncbi:uncharacterized protein LOC127136835 [Lathyrus oleraceus]|uniref:uncharacterized protein LOC127136835 n=1 Tax=Pisum sativum TaxID=3888 RepID=UPI0021D2F9FD|nr:uncharacterized protein LOC127136835 [Pisum sativum]
MFPKAIVSVDIKLVEMKHDVKPDKVNDDVKPDEMNDDVKSGARSVVVEVDVRTQFTNKEEFIVHKRMLQWVRREVGKSGFYVIIESSDNGSERRQSVITKRCERSDTYQPHIRKFKRDDIESRKCGCPFKLREYRMVDETWKFNVIFDIHNHALTDKLVGHPIIYHIVPEEMELFSDMT